jgi:hypothetical protein
MNPMHPYVAEKMIAARQQEMINQANMWRIAAEARRARRAERKARREARRSAGVIAEPKQPAPAAAPTTSVAPQAG